MRLEPTHILRETSPGTGTAQRIPRVAIHGLGYGYQCCSHINVRFSLWIAVIDRFVDTFAWRRSYCRRYAFDFAVDCVFSAIGLPVYALCAPNAAQYAVSMGRLMFLNMAIPAPEVSKPEYHDSTYQTELFGVKRGMDLDEDETFELTEAAYTSCKGKSRKLLQDTTEEWNTIPVQDELAIIDAAVGVYDEEGWDYFVEVAFWSAVFCSLAIFGHLWASSWFAKALGHSAFMTIPAIELLALLIVGPGVTRALMVVMVNQTDAGYAVGMCGMGFAFSLLCVRRVHHLRASHHTQNQFVNAEMVGI